MTKLTRIIFLMTVGVLLGLIQLGLFLQLSFMLSSSYGTYLMVTLAWLLGSAIGVTKLMHLPLKLLFVVMISGYLIINVLVTLLPAQTGLWPVYAVIISLMGLYPGAFFGQMGRYYPARILFFHENNGFILGMASGTLLFALYGHSIIWGIATTISILLLLIPERLIKPRDV